MVHSIDELIDRLDEIVAESQRNNSPEGYFAVLYAEVTRRVRSGIEAGEFEDADRMRKLDVAFGNRYLVARDRFHGGEDPGLAWGEAFRATRRWRPIVLQHLLLGINAHINLDLGIAAAEIAPGTQIDELENDFNGINDILSKMVDEVEAKLARIWPALAWLDRVGGRTDEALVNFGIEKAREHAWSAALRLSSLNDDERDAEIRSLDAFAAEIANRVLEPGWLISAALLWVRVTERGTVAEKIGKLK